MNCTPLTLVSCAAVICLALTCAAAWGEGLVLAQDGKTDYTIVTGERGLPAERYAAEELQRFLGKITGAQGKWRRL